MMRAAALSCLLLALVGSLLLDVETCMVLIRCVCECGDLCWLRALRSRQRCFLEFVSFNRPVSASVKVTLTTMSSLP